MASARDIQGGRCGVCEAGFGRGETRPQHGEGLLWLCLAFLVFRSEIPAGFSANICNFFLIHSDIMLE